MACTVPFGVLCALSLLLAPLSSEAWSRLDVKEGKIHALPFVSVIQNYYMTDPISRNSLTMAHCTKDILGNNHQIETKRVVNG